MSGCAVCVYDLYDESVVAYREEIEKVKRRLREMGVDERAWPVELRARAGSVVVDAFDQLGRELAAKRGQSNS